MKAILIAVVLGLLSSCASSTGGGPSECRIELTGFSEAQVGNITATNVMFVLDGHSHLRINAMTAQSVTTESGGYSRVSQRSE